MVATPIKGDLPDWSRPSPDEAPILLLNENAIPVDNPYTVFLDVPPNAVALAIGGYGTGVKAVVITGQFTELTYLDVNLESTGNLGYNTFPVFAVTDTTLNITVTYSSASNSGFFVWAYTTIPPFGLRPDGVIAVQQNHENDVSRVLYKDTAVAGNTGVTVLGIVDTPLVGQAVVLDTVFGRVGPTASAGQANMFLQLHNVILDTTVGRIAEVDSFASGFNVFSYAPALYIPHSGNPQLPQIQYRNSSSSAVQMTMCMIWHLEGI